jgi:hypothetical protein
VSNRKFKPTLDPKAPGLDEATRRRRETLAALEAMSSKQVLRMAIKAGIFTESGKLTKRYRDDAEGSATRPSD